VSSPNPPVTFGYRSYEGAALAAGLFGVDAEGRVWRLRRFGRPCAPYRAESPRADGYLAVPLVLGCRRVRVLAHRLVYEARVGSIPDGWIVRQRNGARADNRPENLVTAPWPIPGKRRAPTDVDPERLAGDDPSGRMTP